MHAGIHDKCLLFLSDFNKPEACRKFFAELHNFMKICSAVHKLFHRYKWTATLEALHRVTKATNTTNKKLFMVIAATYLILKFDENVEYYKQLF
jgi:hypothetical protein